MQADLEAVSRLWRVDKELDEAKATIVALRQARRDTHGLCKELAAELEELQGTLAEHVRREQGLQTELAGFNRKKKQTQELIDLGKAPDFEVATRQIDSLSELIDDRETQLLELFEEKEATELAISRNEEKQQRAQLKRKRADQAEAKERPSLEARIEELKPVRDERWAQVQYEDQIKYHGLRRRDRDVLTHLVGGVCFACGSHAPAQVLNEVVSGKRTHTCRGCGRYFLHARDKADEPGDPEASDS